MEVSNTETQKQEAITYKSRDSGPFITIIEGKNKDQNVGQYHPMAISQILINLKIKEIKEVKRQGTNKISVDFFSYSQRSFK